MSRILLPFLLVICVLTAKAQENFPMGARSVGMGNATVALNDVWAVHHNQAALGMLEDAGVSVYYENRWLTAGFDNQGAAISIPTGRIGSVGVIYSRFGNSLYNQSKYGVSYGMRLAKGFYMGVGLNYHDTRLAENYGNKGNFVAEIGIMGEITKKIRVGFHAYNLTRAILVSDSILNDRLPMIFRLGGSYIFSEKVQVAVEVEKDLDLAPIVKLGAEYRPSKLIFIRVGFNTQPFTPSIGLGFHVKGIRLDLATTIHPILGVSPSASLTYNFSIRKKKPEITITVSDPEGPSE